MGTEKSKSSFFRRDDSSSNEQQQSREVNTRRRDADNNTGYQRNNYQQRREERGGDAPREFKPRHNDDNRRNYNNTGKESFSQHGSAGRSFRPREDRQQGGNESNSYHKSYRDNEQTGENNRFFKSRFNENRGSQSSDNITERRSYGVRDNGGNSRYRTDNQSGRNSDFERKPRREGGDNYNSSENREFRPRRDDFRRNDNKSFGERRDSSRSWGEGNREFKPRTEGNREFKPRTFDNNRDGFKPRRQEYGNAQQSEQRTSFGGLRERKPRIEKPTFAPQAEVLSDEPLRLNRFIAMSGVCSRREADELITAGQVTVNGAVADQLGTKVTRHDDIRLNGEKLKGEKKVYIIMNKPKGYVTTTDDPHADRTVIDLLKGQVKERVYPVGRLDKNTTGVLLLTNDGELTNELTHPSYEKRKLYHVFLNKPCTTDDIAQLLAGVELEDGLAQADEAELVSDAADEVGIEIHSGKNRIVRRMFEHLGYDVVKLDRVFFAGFTKMGLRRGFWRFLTPREVAVLRGGQYK